MTKRIEIEYELKAEEDDDIQDYKKPWVGLTDSEIGTIAYNVNPLDGIRQFSRAIEAKLKEKNT